MINFKFKLIAICATVFFSIFLVYSYSSSDQKGALTNMEENATVIIAAGETAFITNMWKDEGLKDWVVKIKGVSIEKSGVIVQITSSAFIEKEINKQQFIKINGTVSIIQSEEITTEIMLMGIRDEKAIFAIKIHCVPPAPEPAKIFSIQIEKRGKEGVKPQL